MERRLEMPSVSLTKACPLGAPDDCLNDPINIIFYYQCVEDHFETLEQLYDERFAKQYGFFRPYVRKVIYRYLDCGILHNGFARVKCEDCNYKYLLAFSCKRRHFCPSCHQKRVVEFGEYLCEEILKAVPHRHFVFSIPKILRRYFLGACPRPDRGTAASFPI